MAQSIARPRALRASFARNPAHADKKGRGRAALEQTPLTIVTPRFAFSGEFEEYVRSKLGVKLGKFATQIERVSVTFLDLNGPKRGIDTECRVQVTLHPLAPLLVSERGVNARQAFDFVCNSVARAVQRSLARAGYSEGRARKRERGSVRQNPKRSVSSDDRDDREVSPSKARITKLEARGGPAPTTAGRNARKRTTKAAVALEDSATGKPSRKSTRKGANRLKSGETIERVARDRVSTPQFRATSAGVRRK